MVHLVEIQISDIYSILKIYKGSYVIQNEGTFSLTKLVQLPTSGNHSIVFKELIGPSFLIHTGD